MDKILFIRTNIKFNKKPTGLFSKIHGEINQAKQSAASVQEFFDMANNGYCFKLGEFRTVDNKNEFIKSNYFILDIDDHYAASDPNIIAKETGAIGYYFTFSHGSIKGKIKSPQNRYRLLYRSAAPLNSIDEFKQAQEQLKKEIIKICPSLDKIIINGTSKNQIDIINGFFFGTNKGYKIFDTFKSHDIKIVKKKEYDSLSSYNNYTSEDKKEIERELIKAFEFIDKNSLHDNIEDYDTWKNIPIALFNLSQRGIISQDIVIYCLMRYDRDKNHKPNYYINLFKRPLKNRAYGLVKIREDLKKYFNYSFNLVGFSVIDKKEKEKFIHSDYRKIAINKYIETENIPEDILQNKKSLFVADTGTGKTTSLINFLKEKVEQEEKEETKNIFIICAPTVALTEQIGNQNNIAAFSGVINKYDMIAAIKKRKIIVVTFDKLINLTRTLRLITNNEKIKINVIIDEVHHLITDYRFRNRVLKNFIMLDELADTQIHLTATPEDFEMTSYDTIYHFVDRDYKKPYREAGIILYDNYRKPQNSIINVIKHTLENKEKMLVFINNKKMANRLRIYFSKKGYKTALITSNTKHSPTYLNILKNGQIDNNIDLIFCTSVLADGISILNQSNSYNIMVVTHPTITKFFNISMIKQISHRLRNPYNNFIVMVQEIKEKKQYTENSRYDRKRLKKIFEERAEEIVNLNNNTDNEYIKGILEKKLWIFEKINKDGTKTYDYDKRGVYSEILEKIEKDFSFNPTLFINALGDILDYNLKTIQEDQIQLLDVLDFEELTTETLDDNLPDMQEVLSENDYNNNFVRKDFENLESWKERQKKYIKSVALALKQEEKNLLYILIKYDLLGRLKYNDFYELLNYEDKDFIKLDSFLENFKIINTDKNSYYKDGINIIKQHCQGINGKEDIKRNLYAAYKEINKKFNIKKKENFEQFIKAYFYYNQVARNKKQRLYSLSLIDYKYLNKTFKNEELSQNIIAVFLDPITDFDSIINGQENKGIKKPYN